MSLGGRGEFLIDEKGIAVIRPPKTKHGPRKNWREIEFAQLAIQALYGATPPKVLNGTKLTRRINDWLKDNPDWRSSGYGNQDGEISKRTVLRALKKVFP